jgi:hypothetical protein
VVGYIPLNGRVVLVLVAAGVAIAVACSFIAGPSPESLAHNPVSVDSPAVTQCIAAAQAGIDRIDAIHPHCPAFLDAPIGNKPCPLAKGLADARTKMLERQRECRRTP